MEGTPATHPALYEACEAVGRMMELWGFKRIHGMVWTFLFLSARPLSAQDVREGLDISTGLVSMTLADLQRWSVVHRRSPPGERRDFFEAEANIWRPILKVLREREYYQMTATVEELRALQKALSKSTEAHEAYAAGRLAELIMLGDTALHLFGQLLELGGMLLGDASRMAIASGMGETLVALRRLLTREGLDR
jgi:DNA-binding transcriptional regulator GbsR (MarR family)